MGKLEKMLVMNLKAKHIRQWKTFHITTGETKLLNEINIFHRQQ